MTDPYLEALDSADLDASRVCRCRDLLARFAEEMLPLCADAPPVNGPRPGDAKLLTSAQVADRLAISPRTLWRLLKSGQLPQPIRYNRKLVRWNAAALDRYLATLTD